MRPRMLVAALAAVGQIAVATGGLVALAPSPAAAAASAGAVPAGGTRQLTVGGQAGVPADASAVVLNVTAADPASAGFLTVYPCGQPRPLASNVNYAAGQTVPNLVIAKIGADRQVCIFSLQQADVIVDVSGYFPAASDFTTHSQPAADPRHAQRHGRRAPTGGRSDAAAAGRRRRRGRG